MVIQYDVHQRLTRAAFRFIWSALGGSALGMLSACGYLSLTGFIPFIFGLVVEVQYSPLLVVATLRKHILTGPMIILDGSGIIAVVRKEFLIKRGRGVPYY